MAAKLKEKRTSITTVRDQNLSFATFPTPLLFHYPLPLKKPQHFKLLEAFVIKCVFLENFPCRLRKMQKLQVTFHFQKPFEFRFR
jgi:hypothetical protein